MPSQQAGGSEAVGVRVGVDLGGSWMRVGVLEPGGADLVRIERHPSPTSWHEFVELLRRHDSADVDGFAIATAATLEDHARIVVAPNLRWLNGRNARQELQAALGKRVVLSNDMEAATEGEMARGVLRAYRWAIFDTISTGWGGNLVLDGQRVDGEPGHTHVRFDPAWPCGCGNHGCNEALYSGSAMHRRITQALGGQATDPWPPFLRAADTGVPWAAELLDEWSEGVGRAWGNVLNRLRPIQAIVYMGTTATTLLALPCVQERVRSTLRHICKFPEHQSSDFPILPAQEENRGVYGALIVYERVS